MANEMYGGTKAELERLVEDANTYKEAMGEVGDLAADNFADVVEAIHIVQTEMGITGTTAEEAATTIEGSVNSMKAAWENWLTGLGRSDVDMGELTEKLVDSVLTAGENVVPRVAEIIESAAEVVATRGPAVARELVNGIVSALPDGIAEYVGPLLESMVSGLSSFLSISMSVARQALPYLKAGLSALASILKTASAAMSALESALGGGDSALLGLLSTLLLLSPVLTSTGGAMGAVTTATKLASSAMTLVKTKAIPGLIGALGDLGTPIAKVVTGLASIGTPATLLATIVGGALVAAVSALAVEAAEAAEHEQLMADVTRDAASIMREASGSAESLGDAIGSLEADVDGVLLEMQELSQSTADLFSNAVMDSSKLDQYVSTINELANQAGLSATQQYQLAQAIEGYNDIVGTQYSVVDAVNGIIADENGTIQESTDQLNANAEAWKANAYAKALSTAAAEYMEAEVKAAYELQVAQENLNAAYEERERLMDIVEGRAEGDVTEAAMAIDRLNREIPDLVQDVDDLSEAYDTAAQNATDFADSAAIMSAVYGTLGDSAREFIADLLESGAEMSTFTSMTDEQLQTLATSWDGTTGSIIDAMLSMQQQVPASMYQAMLGMSEAIDEGGAEAISSALTVSGMTAQQFADSVSSYGLSGSAAITAFANAIAAGDSTEVAAQKAQDAVDAMDDADATEAGSSLDSEYGSGIASNASAATSAASSVASQSVTALDTGDSYDSGAHLIENFAAGMKSALDWAVGTASSIMSSIKSTLGFSVPKEGPFSGAEKGGETSGYHLVENFARGMRSASYLVAEAAEAILEDVRFDVDEAAGAAASDMRQALADAFVASTDSVPVSAALGLSLDPAPIDVSGVSSSTVVYNYYIGDTQVTTTSDREFAERFVALMDDFGRLART